MTDEMLALAQANRAKAGASNVAFLKGQIEAIPLQTNTVDVVISTCVINLAADKSQVLREAFRVLKPGGRFAVSDVVADGSVPTDFRSSMEAWVGCLAGALEIDIYQHMLAEAGFEDKNVEITRRYTVAEAGLDPNTLPAGWEAGDGKLASAFVRATSQSPRPLPTQSGTMKARRSQSPAAVAVASAVAPKVHQAANTCTVSLPALLEPGALRSLCLLGNPRTSRKEEQGRRDKLRRLLMRSPH